jgi:hypothetical protein
MLSKFKKFLTISVLMVMVACGGSGSRDAVSQFISNLNYEDPFDSYFLAKRYTEQGNGWIIVEVAFGEYYAFNMNSLNFYGSDLQAFWDTAIPAFAIPFTNNFIDIDGYIYEKTAGSSQDLEKIGAKIEEGNNLQLSEKLVAEYGLSEERSLELAPLIREYQNLEKIKEISDADANAFLGEALGIDVKAAIAELKKSQQGQSNNLQGFIDQAANHNGVTNAEDKAALIKKLLLE